MLRYTEYEEEFSIHHQRNISTMSKSTILIFLLLSGIFNVGLSQAQTGHKRPLQDVTQIKKNNADGQFVAKRTRTQLREQSVFLKACDQRGRVLKKCKEKANKLFSQCVDTETESTPSDSEYDNPEEGIVDLSLPADDLTFPEVTRDTIEIIHSKACFLQKHGEHTLAAESLEHAIDGLQYQNSAVDDTLLPESFTLFQHWASLLPHIAKDKSEAQLKIKQWMNAWPAPAWLDHASEILVELLSAAFEMENHDEPNLPSYDDTWLDDVLASIEDQPARNSIKHLVQALSTDEPVQREKHHRDAILAGYSHPLPFLQMIEYLVNQQRFEEAHHIFEMYRLVVIFNTYWSNPGKKTSGPKYAHRKELCRLQVVFEKILVSMNEHVYTSPDYYSPTLKCLDDSIKNWPESSRQQAEDMLFEKTFQTVWSMCESIIEFSRAVISRSRQRWLDSGKMEAQVTVVQDYLRTVNAPRVLPMLHEQLAWMLTDLGREREAADVLYKFVSGYREGVNSDYDLSLYLIAVAHELNAMGAIVAVPSYDESMRLVKNVKASAQSKALGERLKEIRRKARTSEADIAYLQQLYLSIPEELARFNSGNTIKGFSSPMILMRSLTTLTSDSGIPRLDSMLKWLSPGSETARDAKHQHLLKSSQYDEKEHNQAVSSLVPPGYVPYDVPADGLCMYHALSQMHNIPLSELLSIMHRKLQKIQQQIAYNLSQSLPWSEGLTQTDQQMIQPIIHTFVDHHHQDNLAELQYAIETLEQAINYVYHGGIAPRHVWGMHSLLNTAATALSEILHHTATPFIAQLPTLNASGTAHTGASHFMQYNPDGSSSQVVSSSSLNGLPLLVHTEGNHWIYALQIASQSAVHSSPVAPMEQLTDVLSNSNLDHSNTQNLHYLFQHIHLTPEIDFGVESLFGQGVFRFSAQ